MATLHIARRTTPHHPHTSLRERWAAFRLRHFRRQAADHPEAVTARAVDAEQLALARADEGFRHAHPAPEHRWSPTTVSAYHRLMDDVRGCFHPGGAA